MVRQRKLVAARKWFVFAGFGLSAALPLILYFVGIGTARRIVDGDTTVFKMSPLILVSVIVLAAVPFLIGCAVATLRGVFWLFAGPLFASSGLLLVALVPIPWVPCVEVSPSGFVCWLGYSFWSVERRIEFEETFFLAVCERPGDTDPLESGPQYDLHCFLKSEDRQVVLPVGDSMKVALPDIFAAASKRGIPVSSIPDALTVEGHGRPDSRIMIPVIPVLLMMGSMAFHFWGGPKQNQPAP